MTFIFTPKDDTGPWPTGPGLISVLTLPQTCAWHNRTALLLPFPKHGNSNLFACPLPDLPGKMTQHDPPLKPPPLKLKPPLPQKCGGLGTSAPGPQTITQLDSSSLLCYTDCLLCFFFGGCSCWPGMVCPSSSFSSEVEWGLARVGAGG